MEAIIVYSLVLIFFVLIFLFAVLVLLRHPYAEPVRNVEVNSAHEGELRRTSDKVTFGFLIVLMVSFFVMTFLSERKHSRYQ